jgi:hypothetical protein
MYFFPLCLQIPIKKLLLLIEMSKQAGAGGGSSANDLDKKIDLTRFEECYLDLSQ